MKNRKRCVDCGRLFLRPFDKKAVKIQGDNGSEFLACPDCEKPIVDPRVRKMVQEGVLDEPRR